MARFGTRVRNSEQMDGGICLGHDVWVFQNAGVPVNGTSGTRAGSVGKGSICVDRTNGKQYTNTGTKASPTWAVTGSQS